MGMCQMQTCLGDYLFSSAGYGGLVRRLECWRVGVGVGGDELRGSVFVAVRSGRWLRIGHLHGSMGRMLVRYGEAFEGVGGWWVGVGLRGVGDVVW
ncbi:hypothetical protein Tco_0968028 [Tanacetum coccineum]